MAAAGLERTVKIRYLPYFFPVFGYRMPYFHVNTVYGATVVHVALTDSEILSVHGKSTNVAPTQRIC
jgi:hypothetical protein